ncbi:hypothetical protein PHLGIDRAFT_384520 [Phlebiopsis gigantea 11061_1 CR5-6]|uniref:Uncharacterized protein n=1 Tax=Phlebiopsis gigantea (strain 11061_1 CR5-6) TaxID=745531 RepID=A0A0C3NSQ3_PHLG1|nr:hypothetical protein PHLGIDRAFT_384520 [Phlebiopsis gigantea 11061_1 CR5-6]
MSTSRSSPSLRKRQLTPDVLDEKTSLLASVSSARAKSTVGARHLLALVSLSISAFFIFRTSFATREASHAYALCSPDGNNIYTVDDVTPRVQCLVVHDGKFVDIGSLGQ